MPDNKVKVVKTSYPKDSKNDRNGRNSRDDKPRDANTEYFDVRRDAYSSVPVKITDSLLLDFIKFGGTIREDTRSINYLISTLSPYSSDNFTLLQIWLIYKEALKPNKIDLSTAILLVQASGKKVVERGTPSRLYYIKAAHAYTLKAENGSQRFYINLVHSLYSCGSKDLADVYTQIQDPVLEISFESRDRLKTMLDSAVKEYQTFGLRDNVVYADDQRLPQTQSTTEKHPITNHVYQAEQSLQTMAVHVDKQIKDYCAKFAGPHEKVKKAKTQAPIVTEKFKSSHQEAELLAIKQQQYISDIECAAEEKNWIRATEIFDKAIAELPNNSFIYNAMLLAGDKCNCDASYAETLYSKAIKDNFADINTHINAFLVFSKTRSKLDRAWYAYSEIKRLGGISATICSLMATIALLHNETDYAKAVMNDVKEKGFDAPKIIYDKTKRIIEHTKSVTQLEDRSAILEVSSDANSTTPQINITGNATMFSPLPSSIALSKHALFGVRSSVPSSVPVMKNQVLENSSSHTP